MEGEPVKAPSSQPKDTSLDAYKVWIMELATRLTTGDIQMTDLEWKQHWREF